MIGDGLNDAGALQQAEVGVAISNDVYSFSPASDAILEAKQFNKLAHFIQVSKSSLKVVQASFILSLMYNAVGLYFAVQALLTPLMAAVLMPLSSVSVIVFVVVGTGWIGRER
jgi:Cu+-exporting ATPase